MDHGKKLFAISAIERAGSVFSLIGSIFVITTFCYSSNFRKPVNRLVFYASFGNIMTNVGTLMARSYLDEPASPACQFQGFLIQMFLPADAFWTIAMAVNVYLTFYHKFDAQRLRSMELPYLVLCYGIPLIPALTFIFIKSANGDRVYGDATLWCWITPTWEPMRIALFYGPIWFILIITFFIYIRAGRTIYDRRKQLRNFDSSEGNTVAMENAYGSVKTTEVSVTTEIIDEPTVILGLSDRVLGSRLADARAARQYTVTISADKRQASSGKTSTNPENTVPTADNGLSPTRRRNYEVNNAAWSYTKCSILFFTAILVTWLPSSANRVYSFVHANRQSIVLEHMSALVLPLQGFWNALIYTVTSWRAVRMVFRETGDAICCWRRKREKGQEVLPDSSSSIRPDSSGRRNRKQFESESTTELAGARRPSSTEQSSSL